MIWYLYSRRGENRTPNSGFGAILQKLLKWLKHQQNQAIPHHFRLSSHWHKRKLFWTILNYMTQFCHTIFLINYSCDRAKKLNTIGQINPTPYCLQRTVVVSTQRTKYIIARIMYLVNWWSCKSSFYKCNKVTHFE